MKNVQWTLIDLLAYCILTHLFTSYDIGKSHRLFLQKMIAVSFVVKVTIITIGQIKIGPSSFYQIYWGSFCVLFFCWLLILKEDIFMVNTTLHGHNRAAAEEKIGTSIVSQRIQISKTQF